MRGRWCKNKESREGGLSALEGDLRKALGRSFLRWEKDKVKESAAQNSKGSNVKNFKDPPLARHSLRGVIPVPVCIKYALVRRVCPEDRGNFLDAQIYSYEGGEWPGKKRGHLGAASLLKLRRQGVYFTSYSASMTSSGPFFWPPAAPAAASGPPAARASVAVAPPA